RRRRAVDGDRLMPTLPEVVAAHRDDILSEWVLVQEDPLGRAPHGLGELNLARESQEFLGLFATAVADDESGEIGGPGWEPVRSFLSDLARARAPPGLLPPRGGAVLVFDGR